MYIIYISLAWPTLSLKYVNCDKICELLQEFWQCQSDSFGHMTFTTEKKFCVTGDKPCCISTITNNHSVICGFLRRSSIQQSKLES